MTDLILNGGFEKDAQGQLANWHQWHEQTPRPKEGFDYAFQPQWNCESLERGAAAELVYAGDRSLRIYNNWDPWNAGVYQIVNVTPGQPYRISAYARLWAAHDGWPSPSDESVNALVRLGVLDDQPDKPTYSNPISPHNKWMQVAFEYTPKSPANTVFLGTSYRGYSCQFMMVFWDQVVLKPVYKTYLPNIQR